MKKMDKLLLAMGALVLSNAVVAATAVGTLNVTASILANCLFTPATAVLPFGTLPVADLADGKNEVTPAAVLVTCTNSGTAAKLYGGATRAMSNGTDTVAYEVYTDSARTDVFGSTSGTGVSVVADGTPKTIPLYGKTTAAQGAKSTGSYSQALVLTVEF